MGAEHGQTLHQRETNSCCEMRSCPTSSAIRNIETEIVTRYYILPKTPAIDKVGGPGGSDRPVYPGRRDGEHSELSSATLVPRHPAAPALCTRDTQGGSAVGNDCKPHAHQQRGRAGTGTQHRVAQGRCGKPSGRPCPAVQKAARHSAQARWAACTEEHNVMAANVPGSDAGQQPAL